MGTKPNPTRAYRQRGRGSPRSVFLLRMAPGWTLLLIPYSPAGPLACGHCCLVHEPAHPRAPAIDLLTWSTMIAAVGPAVVIGLSM